jgi:hypothetical protein
MSAGREVGARLRSVSGNSRQGEVTERVENDPKGNAVIGGATLAQEHLYKYRLG